MSTLSIRFGELFKADDDGDGHNSDMESKK